MPRIYIDQAQVGQRTAPLSGTRPDDYSGVMRAGGGLMDAGNALSAYANARKRADEGMRRLELENDFLQAQADVSAFIEKNPSNRDQWIPYAEDVYTKVRDKYKGLLDKQLSLEYANMETRALIEVAAVERRAHLAEKQAIATTALNNYVAMGNTEGIDRVVNKAVEAGVYSKERGNAIAAEYKQKADFTNALKMIDENPFDAKTALNEKGAFANLGYKERRALIEDADRKILKLQTNKAAQIAYDSAASGIRMTDEEIKRMAENGEISNGFAAGYIEGNRKANDAKLRAEAQYNTDNYFAIHQMIVDGAQGLDDGDIDEFKVAVVAKIEESGLAGKLKTMILDELEERLNPNSAWNREPLKSSFEYLDQLRKAGAFESYYVNNGKKYPPFGKKSKKESKLEAEEIIAQRMRSFENYESAKRELLNYYKKNPNATDADIKANVFNKYETLSVEGIVSSAGGGQ